MTWRNMFCRRYNLARGLEERRNGNWGWDEGMIHWNHLRRLLGVVAVFALMVPGEVLAATFTEQGATVLGGENYSGRSVSLADIDNDGDLDAFFQGSARRQAGRCLRNNIIGTGSFTFTNVTSTMVPSGLGCFLECGLGRLQRRWPGRCVRWARRMTVARWRRVAEQWRDVILPTRATRPISMIPGFIKTWAGPTSITTAISI